MTLNNVCRFPFHMPLKNSALRFHAHFQLQLQDDRTNSLIPDLACEAGVWCRLLPLLVDPGLSGVGLLGGGDPRSDLLYTGVRPIKPGGTHMSSNGTFPLDSTRPGVDWLRPIAAKKTIETHMYF